MPEFKLRRPRRPRRIRPLALPALLLTLALGASAANEQDAAKWGATLTPLGGDKAASGGVPAWEGADRPVGAWEPGKPRFAAWSRKDEKPSFSIDEASSDKHAERLTPGQRHLLKNKARYTMDVYPSHRSCSAPEWVAANTRRNAGQARLTADGISLEKALLPGVPFPQPDNGAQVMWNFQVRYQGVGVDYPSSTTMVSPRNAGSPWLVLVAPQHFFYPWGAKGAVTPADVGQVLGGLHFKMTEPAAQAGQALMSRNYFDNRDMDTFWYFPGQRRVRRLPSYAYDAPQIGYENQYTIDQTQMFTGNLDRFNWKLAGKKEIYVPYNTFKLVDPNTKSADVYKDDMVNAAQRRYELHRVWVVEASLKDGMRHTMPKRTFYVDEDSWLIVVAEDYDAQGKLWKVREASLFPAWELEGACVSATFTQYDVQQGRYLADFVTSGSGKDARWYLTPPDHRFKIDFFTADSLRALSER
jgi:hypothetical protein